MAVIHKGRHEPRKRLRRARALLVLCWPLAVLTLLLAVMLYWQSWQRLLDLAESWRVAFTSWAISGGVDEAFSQPWHQTLWDAIEMLLRGLGWGIFGLTVAAPGLLAIGMATLFICLFRPTLRLYRSMSVRVKAMAAAMKLLAPMPDSCHIFRYKRISFEGGSAQTELILVSPGGVVVMEVRNAPGIIEGCVTDAVLRRRSPDGDVEKLRNPARPAVVGMTRLSDYLLSQGLRIRVTPCVLFVHPEASAYVTPPDLLSTGGRRTRISTCVMTDATSFWEQLGRTVASGRLLAQGTVDTLVSIIRKAPEGKRREC